jgi:hypothetical protein
MHSSSEIRAGVEKPALKYRREIVWPNVAMHIYLNVAALYGAYLMLTSAKILTGIWGMCKCLYSVCKNVHKSVCEYAKGCVYRRVCTYLLTYLLSLQSRVLLEKLEGFQLVKKYPKFYGARRFITAFKVPATSPYTESARSSP